MTKQKTAYLIYRPSLEHDDNVLTYLICETEEKAKRVIDEILLYCHQLQASMLPLPSSVRNSEEYSDYEKRRCKALASAVWPYGIDLSDEFYHNPFDPRCICYEDLPLITDDGEAAQ